MAKTIEVKPLLLAFSITLVLILFVSFSFLFLKDHPGEIDSLRRNTSPFFLNGTLNLDPEPGEKRMYYFGLSFLPFATVITYMTLSRILGKRVKFQKLMINPYLNVWGAQISLMIIIITGAFIIKDVFITKFQNIYLIFHSPLFYFLFSIA